MYLGDLKTKTMEPETIQTGRIRKAIRVGKQKY
jgi:hypothetical protein